MKKKDDMVLAIAKEIQLRKNEFHGEIIETIYFGGGTPSVLTNAEILTLIETVYQNFEVSENPEITLETNPDDLSEERIIALSQTPINRLSIGVQSFFEEDLKLMNRAHNSAEAKRSLAVATQYFDNISVDLIYGIPGLTNEMWLENIETALSFGIPHISSYALTVEPKTALHKLIQTGKITAPKDDVAQEHFEILVKTLTEKGFIHYELSNFGKPDYFSQNNSSYWLGKKYLGIGPSAHSFDGKSRSWNVSNNMLYLKSILDNKVPLEVEILSEQDRYNEYVMTGLRTIWGVSLERIEKEFGADYLTYLLQQANKFIADGLLSIDENVMTTTAKGKFLADGIASDLFKINQEG
jgi:oxygen-independent coproporphyrinogen-3 oxidase